MAEIICKEDNEVDFSDLDRGIVFKYKNDFYIKTDVVQTTLSAFNNCVSLKTGQHICIDPDTKVSIYNKITLERL